MHNSQSILIITIVTVGEAGSDSGTGDWGVSTRDGGVGGALIGVAGLVGLSDHCDCKICTFGVKFSKRPSSLSMIVGKSRK